MKEKLQELLKKYPYGLSIFYLKCVFEGKEIEMTHYSKHFFVKDDFLEIDAPHMQVPWSDVLEIKLYEA